MSRAYLASDDSRLIRKVLSRFSGPSCLEIGVGNGGNLAELAKRFDVAVGTEIVQPRQILGEDLVIADRATCFRDGVFDLVAFNPPYLQSESIEDVAVDGGKDGGEVPLAFLNEAIRVVKPKGRIVMLLSNQNPTMPFESLCAERGLKMTLVESERLFYEILAVYRIERAVTIYNE